MDHDRTFPLDSETISATADTLATRNADDRIDYSNSGLLAYIVRHGPNLLTPDATSISVVSGVLTVEIS